MGEELSSAWDGLAQPRTFEEYSEAFADFFVMRRENGIIELRMHTDGGPFMYTVGGHNAWGQAWSAVGNDPENEVLIITGTGDTWMLTNSDPGYFDKPAWTWPGHERYRLHYDARKLMENLLYGVDIPTIAAVNGPGSGHTEFAVACDITICSEETTFGLTSFATGGAPGDGQYLSFYEAIGTKRSAYYAYTCERVDAASALRLGLVAEVVPRERLVPRAWELAEMIMRRPKNARRMTHAIASRPWKRRMVDDFEFGIAHGGFAIGADKQVGAHGGHPLQPIAPDGRRVPWAEWHELTKKGS